MEPNGAGSVSYRARLAAAIRAQHLHAMPSDLVRRTYYWMHGQCVSLAYMPNSDRRPEVTNDNRPPPAQQRTTPDHKSVEVKS